MHNQRIGRFASRLSRAPSAVACLMVIWSLALNSTTPAQQTHDAEQVNRIRQIVLSRGNDPAALAHLVQLSSDIEPSAAAELFVQVADDYLQSGFYNRAGEVLRQLLDQYPEQEASTSGILSLVRLYASSEIVHAQQASFRSLGSSKEQSFAVYGLYAANKAKQKRRALVDEPAFAFQCSVAARLSGKPRVAKSWLTPLKHNPRSEAWHTGALAEDWLQGDRERTPPKPTYDCVSVDVGPHLDAMLDEPLWQAVPGLHLSSLQESTDDASAEIRLACDKEFLYFAVYCQKLPGVEYVDQQLPRTYDADLAGHDRVQLKLDLDRDYATFYQLSVDHRGQTADVCWRDASWNPRWYVAHDENENSWTIEAAVPWSELTGTPPRAGDAWALSVQRLIPGRNSQVWAGSGSEKPTPDSFGLLLFD